MNISTTFILGKINLNTLVFNFKFLPFKSAIKFPVFIHKRVLLKNLSGSISIPKDAPTGIIWIGFGDVGIFDVHYSRTILEIKGQLVFTGTTFIGQVSRISVGKSGVLSIGEKFKITAENIIVCFHKITIGNEVLLSWQVQIMDTDFHSISYGDEVASNPDEPITIGNKVWIGTRCIILKGSLLVEGSIIAANTVVSKKLVETNTIYGGVPVKVLKQNISWKA